MNESASRMCRQCGRKIGPGFPGAFVQQGQSKLLGPFHPKCADSLVKALKNGLELFQGVDTASEPVIVDVTQGELPL